MEKYIKYLLSFLLVLSFAVQGRATTVITEYWDTTIFNTTAPWTNPVEDYYSHTDGVATFLSATYHFVPIFADWWERDGICWNQHFTPPSSYDGLWAALYIYLDDDDSSDITGSGSSEYASLTINGTYIDPTFFFPLQSQYPYADPVDYIDMMTQHRFEVDDGTYMFWLNENMLPWLFNGSLSLLLRAEEGDFYIRSASLYYIGETIIDDEEPIPNPVPEPVTILLFGFSLLGITRIGRKEN